MSDLLRAAIRAHTEPASWTSKPPPERTWKPPDDETIVVFDTETTTDQTQALLVGCYWIAQVRWSGATSEIICLEEGLIRPDDGPAWTRAQQRLLKRYV